MPAPNPDCRQILSGLLQAERRHRDEAREAKRRRESLLRRAKLARRRTPADRTESATLRRTYRAAAQSAARLERAAQSAAHWLEERSGVDRQDFLKLETESAFPPEDAGAAARALDDLNRQNRAPDLLAYLQKNHPQAAEHLLLLNPTPPAFLSASQSPTLPDSPSPCLAVPPSLCPSVPPSSSSTIGDLLTTDELARLVGVTKRSFRNVLAQMRKHPDAALRTPEPEVAPSGTNSAAYRYAAIRPLLLHKWPTRAIFLPDNYKEVRHWLDTHPTS